MIQNIKKAATFIYKAFIVWAVATSHSKTEAAESNIKCIALTPKYPITETYSTDYTRILEIAKHEEAEVNRIAGDIYVSYSQSGSSIVTYDHDLDPSTLPKRIYCIYDYYDLQQPKKEQIQIAVEEPESTSSIKFSANSKNPTYLCTSGEIKSFKVARKTIRSFLCEQGLVENADQCIKDGFTSPRFFPTPSPTEMPTPTPAPVRTPTPYLRAEL